MMNFNIQLFADNLQNTTATMSKEMKTFYEKRLIDQAEPRLVHDQFADYYPVPQNGGKTIEFRKYDSLPKATTPLTEGGRTRMRSFFYPTAVSATDKDFIKREKSISNCSCFVLYCSTISRAKDFLCGLVSRNLPGQV